MGGVEVSYTSESKRLPAVVQESLCPLCTYTFREPLSAKCKHAACKSCLAVLFTRDLPALDRVQCPVCKAILILDELKPDQTALKKLQKIKSCKCKNCNWKGSYSEYIQNHERNCGGGARIQCKVLGCGKWLPEKRALDVHRTDEWCPMILIMKARLNQAEIVHLSMRETWDWTCGLVLRSDKQSVRDLIERLVEVFSALDPKVPITLENDEYAANQTSEPDCSSDSMSISSNQSDIRLDERKEVRPKQNGGSSGKTSPADECDGDSLKRLSSVTFKSEASAATNGFLSSVGDLGSESKGFSGAVSDKDIWRRIESERQKSERDLEKIKKDIRDALKISEPLKNMPRAFAAISDKQEVFESVLATFNKDVMKVHSRLDKLNLSPGSMNPGITEKLQKKYQELERALVSLRQDGQRVEERLMTLETSYSGVYLWPIPNYSERKRDAMNTNIKSIYSPPFFTNQYGYKLCGRVFLMGDGVGKGTHISLFLTIMRGPHDSVLPWPFKERITFQLVNQDDPINKSIVEAFRPDPASSSFKKPTTEKNIGAGCPLFAKIQMIEDPKSGFVRDNTIFLKIISQTSDVPEIK